MKRNFDWTKFDIGFLRKIIIEYGREDFIKRANRCDEEDIDRMAAMMNIICPYPDKNFITRYRTIIEQGLLRNYPEVLKDIFKVMKITKGSMNEKLSVLYAKPTSANLIACYIRALQRISGLNVPMTEFTKFKFIVPVDMKNTQVEEVPLYDFQKEAQARMKQYYLDEDGDAGLLIMPTGSGKSRTATTFLIREMISRGYQVLWIAHRYMLIDQAADCFEKFAGLVKIENPGQSHYRISCVSGEHQSLKQVGDSEIIVASISSLYRNKPHLKRILKNKVMLVVDEAHHSVAPTYDDIIHFVKKTKKTVKLLGLTATPVKMDDRDTRYLMKQYSDKIIYSVPMSNLISEGILSDPHFKKVETKQDFEPMISEDEEKLITRFGELPQTLIGKIAGSNVRNSIITQEYLTHKDEYGKTLIFALNQMHCRFLVEDLKGKNVRCDGVWSGRSDNSFVIDRFKNGDLDVLVNVNIMTEGTDVPDIQTVFLTRPTQSEGFLMQMIGRGMRGVHADGTETVNIIDFHDKWETFNRWLDPEWLIEGEVEGRDRKDGGSTKDYAYDEVEWKLCRDAYRSIAIRHFDMEEQITVPCGWYSLVDEDGQLTRMLVFDNQMDGIQEMVEDCANWSSNLGISPETLRDAYFPEMGSRPSVRDIELLAYNVRTREKLPEMFPLEGRKNIDPSSVVKEAGKNGKDIFEYAGEVYDENPIAKELYGDRENYVMTVCRAKIYAYKVPIGSKVEELPYELIPFSREPYYDIKQLSDEVVAEMFGGEYSGISSISWTRKAYRSYFGIFYEDDNSIIINCVLNSKDVPKEVVKFVIYHELLHRDIHCHNAEFRRRERLYPGYEELEHFLYDNMNQCDIKEW